MIALRGWVNKHRIWLIFIGWTLISLAWLWTSVTSYVCPPRYFPASQAEENYAELLRRYSWVANLNSPWVAMAISLAVGIVLILGTRRWLYLLMWSLVALLGGGIALLASLLCNQTVLSHVDTIEFDQRVYHLTLGREVSIGNDFAQSLLYLHDCDQQSENCRGEIVESSSGTIVQPRILFERPSHLIVFVADAPVFTLDLANDP